MRQSDLKLQKMAALIPTEEMRKAVDEYFMGKHDGVAKPDVNKNEMTSEIDIELKPISLLDFLEP
jgi:hypothetical protein